MNEEFFAIEVNDNRVATLFENTRSVANHRLRDDCRDFGTQIDTELERVLSRVCIARNEQIASGIAQSGDAAERVVKPVNFQAIVIVGQVFCEAQGDFVLIGPIADDDRTWIDDHIIASGDQNRRVGSRVDGAKNGRCKPAIDLRRELGSHRGGWGVDKIYQLLSRDRRATAGVEHEADRIARDAQLWRNPEP